MESTSSHFCSTRNVYISVEYKRQINEFIIFKYAANNATRDAVFGNTPFEFAYFRTPTR